MKVNAIQVQFSIEEWIEEQKKDVVLQPVYQWVQEGKKPTWDEVTGHGEKTKALWGMFSCLKLKQGLLIREFEDEGVRMTRDQVLVPKCFQVQVVRSAHQLGHFGRRRTLAAGTSGTLLAWNVPGCEVGMCVL